MTFERSIVKKIIEFLQKPLPIFQVLIGPRQVGKTTAAHQVIQKLGWPFHYASADGLLSYDTDWIRAQWQLAELKTIQAVNPVLLVLDEIQKIRGWSEVIKLLWDEEKHKGKIKLLILGSSVVLLQKGLTESMAGRFFLQQFPHWSFDECHEVFGWDLNQWLYFGGYPGAAPFISEERIWKEYILNSLIETVIAKDVFQMQTVNKPALLRNLFFIATVYPAQILSYNKMLGQLQDAGNTTTLAHYLQLLQSAFLLSGLELFSKGQIKKRGSSPKLILWNNALINATSSLSFNEFLNDSTWRGRLLENAVGAHILNHLPSSISWSLTYWRKGSYEVDFVLTHGKDIFAIEVKSGRPQHFSGLQQFKKLYPSAYTILIGTGGLDFHTFFSSNPFTYFKT